MKRFAILILLCCLFFSSIAEAKFSDEYRAKYPRRVKVETELMPNGQRSTRTTYTLFKKGLNGSPFKLVFTDCNGFLKLCHLIYGTTTNSHIGFTTFSWGDGASVYELKPFLVYSQRRDPGSYFHYVSASINRHDLDSMERAVVLSLHGGGTVSTALLDKTHKRWKEWQEAVIAAEKLMDER